MDLKIGDVAELLSVSETTIRRWLKEEKIPAYRLNHQYRFSRIEIENWMMSCKLGKKEERTEERAPKGGMQQFSLYRALHRGGIHTDLEATTKEGIIRETMQKVATELSFDADMMSEMLLDREQMMPTALTGGIAVPHTRDFLLKQPFDVVILVTPKKPLDWGALDDKPVHTLFFLFASNDKRHLHLLAKLAHLAGNPALLEYLQSSPPKAELLDHIKSWESKIR